MLVVSVCIGSACHLQRSYEIINILRDLLAKNDLEERVKIKASFCLGNCMGAVCVKCDNKMYSLQPQTTEDFFNTVIREKVGC